LTIQVTKLIGHKELYTDLTPLHPDVCTRRACLLPFQSLRDTPVDTKQFFTTQEITTTSFHTKSSTAEANNMTVNTVSSENVVYVNGKPTFVTGIKRPTVADVAMMAVAVDAAVAGVVVAADVMAAAPGTADIAAVPNSCNPGWIWSPQESFSHSTAKD
jgi:hypothetical protein